MFVRVWEFQPLPDRLEAFHEAYGPAGAWATLFGEASGFLGTTLVSPATDGLRFLTLDRWEDKSAWDEFARSRRREYEDLDRQCEKLTAAEREVGNLRRASLSDAPAIAALAGELGYPTPPAALRARLEIVLHQPDELVLVAEDAGRVVTGWLHVFSARRLEADPYAEVGGLIVADALRGSGIGQALLTSAETWAREQGFDEMRVHSNVVRTRAHGFYERAGYRSSKSQKLFVKRLEPRGTSA